MLSKYVLLLFCIFPLFMYSQVPGYQGKRFFVEGGISVWFNSGNPRANNVGPNTFPDNDDTNFSLQEHYFLSLNYVFSRKGIVSMEYEYSNTGLHTRKLSYAPFNNDAGTVTPSRVIYGLEDEHNLFYNLNIHKINLSFSSYFRGNGHLAPFGWYAKWGLDAVLAKGTLIDQKVLYGHDRDFNDYKPSAEYTNPTGIDTDRLTFMLGAHGGIGYRTIIANRITFNMEARFTVFPQVLDAYARRMDKAEAAGDYATRNNINYQGRIHQRVQAHYYLNVVIGVGVLLF